LSPTQAEMDEALRTMISDGRLTITGVKLFAKNNKEPRKSRKPTYEAVTKLFSSKSEVTQEEFTELIGDVPGERVYRRDCIKHAEKALNEKIIKLSNPQRWVIDRNLETLYDKLANLIRAEPSDEGYCIKQFIKHHKLTDLDTSRALKARKLREYAGGIWGDE
jgi:hypothetical protein